MRAVSFRRPRRATVKLPAILSTTFNCSVCSFASEIRDFSRSADKKSLTASWFLPPLKASRFVCSASLFVSNSCQNRKDCWVSCHWYSGAATRGVGDPNGRGKELGDEATLEEWGVLESRVGWAIHQGCKKGCLELESLWRMIGVIRALRSSRLSCSSRGNTSLVGNLLR